MKGILDYMPTLFPQIDIDNLPVDFQRKLTALIFEKIAPFTFTRKNAPVTLEDALELDMIGLPIGLQELIHSVITPCDDRSGGGIAVDSFLQILWLIVLETGCQVWRQMNGYPNNERASVHEAAHCNTLGKALADANQIASLVDDCFATFPTPTRKKLSEQVIEVEEPLFAWARGSLPTQPPDFEFGKMAVGKVVFKSRNADGSFRYDDAFEGPPVENPKTWADCFRKDAFNTVERRGVAKRRFFCFIERETLV